MTKSTAGLSTFSTSRQFSEISAKKVTTKIGSATKKMTKSKFLLYRQSEDFLWFRGKFQLFLQVLPYNPYVVWRVIVKNSVTLTYQG